MGFCWFFLDLFQIALKNKNKPLGFNFLLYSENGQIKEPDADNVKEI